MGWQAHFITPTSQLTRPLPHSSLPCLSFSREASISDYEAALRALPGDVVLASSFLSYAGPFPSEYRDELVRHTWLPQVSMGGLLEKVE